MKTTAYLAAVLAAASPILVNSALKGAIVLAVGALLTAVCLRKASAAARHAVWLLTMTALLALPVLSVSLPKWRALPPAFKLTPPHATTTPETPHANPTADDSITLHFDWPTDSEGAETITKAIPVSRIATEHSHDAIVLSAPGAETPPATTPETAHWLSALWLLVTTALLTRLVCCHALLWRVVRQSRAPDSPGLDSRFHAIAKSLAITGVTRLLIAPGNSMPKTFGVFRRIVLLPAKAESWSADRLDAVLAHELGHVKRHDTLTQFIVQIACAVYWFNPLVWLAARQMESERERACDDLALNNGFRASDYAQHLLEIVTGCKADELEACASVGMARPRVLKAAWAPFSTSASTAAPSPRLCLASQPSPRPWP